MSNRNVKFTKSVEPCSGKVKLASEEASTAIEGKGSVSIIADNGSSRKNVTVHDVLCVPKLRSNLLSVGKVADRGNIIVFDKEKAEIIDESGNTILTAKRMNGLYYLQVADDEYSGNVETAHESPTKNLTEQWHRKMGHLNVRDLVGCARKGTMKGMNSVKLTEDLICEICLRNKMTRSSFPVNSERSSELLEIIHSDVCGPMRVDSKRKARYFVTFIDDHSRWCEIRVLKQKSEVFSAFKEFKAKVENLHGRKIKCLQSDNGKEYRNEAFDNFLKENGISRRTTVTHTPEQNGVAERRNRTLIEMTRCLLSQSSLPHSFWGEAVNTANYVRNRCPSRSIGGKTAYQLWAGKIPDVSHLEEFGSEVYTLNRDGNKGKLDSRSRKGIFVGYSDETKGYRVWLINEKRTDIARDVKFIGIPKPGNCNEPLTSEENDTSQAEMLFNPGTPRILNTPEENHDDQDEEEDEEGSEHGGEENCRENSNLDAPRRGPGRPRIQRTGTRRRPKKLFHTVNCVGETEETAFITEIPIEQALRGPDAEEWLQAMASEMISIIRNDTWTITDRPSDQKVIGSRVVLRNKYTHEGFLDRRKARVVAKGYTQRPGVDFNETFAPVARLSSVRTLVAIATSNGMKLNHFDVTTAYLNGSLEEEVFMEIPKYINHVLMKITSSETVSADIRSKSRKMLEEINLGDKVCLLKKALYGLRQAGRCWNARIDKELLRYEAKRSAADPCVYIKDSGARRLLIAVYVDDIIVASQDASKVEEFGRYLSSIFRVTDLGPIKYCLGMEFTQRSDEITISQSGYIGDILERFGMTDSKSVSTPLDPGTILEASAEDPDSPVAQLPYRELVGALMYLATRPDIAYSVSFLSQFNSCYDFRHWNAAKRVLRYLQGTRTVGLRFQKTEKPLTGFVDADWANCPEDRRSYTGYSFILSGCPVFWEARKQRTVALSSTEAEYMALSEATKEAVYLRRFFNELSLEKLARVKVYCDNNGARRLAENPVFHNRSKHIDVRHHYVREILEAGEMEVAYTPTEDMAADIFTKRLSRPKHLKCMDLLGLRDLGK